MKTRLLHPEFFTDAKVQALSPNAKVLLLGLWVGCDDYGRGNYYPKQIEAAVFPVEAVDIESLLAEVVESGFIRVYSVGNQSYYEVPTWERWQSPKYKAKSKIPLPGEVGPNSGTSTDQVGEILPAVLVLESELELEQESESLALDQRKGRPRDFLFEALCDVASIDRDELTEVERGKLNKACHLLRAVNADPLDVPRRAVNYALRFNKQPTPMALAGQWAHCATSPPNLDERTIRKRLETNRMGQFLDAWSSA